jgi:hypothetical protein
MTRPVSNPSSLLTSLLTCLLTLGARLALPVLALALGAACPEKKAEEAKVCCDQPKIPAGVAPFKIVGDDASGLYDERVVKIKAVLSGPAERTQIYPVLHAIYRHALTRDTNEPLEFEADVYANEAAATTGGPGVARIARPRGKLAPECENRVAYTFEQAANIAFGEIFLRKAEEEGSDTCKLNESKDQAPVDAGWKLRPAITIDGAAQTATLAYPFRKDTEDAYLEEIKFTSAMKAWIDFATAFFHKVPDLKKLAFIGTHNDTEVLKIVLTREQFNSGFAGLQEDIAAYAAVTFQKLGMGAGSEKAVLKDRENFQTKTYKTALGSLPKDQVTIAKNLK